jgi:beta-N-acetylhexosaminidase
MIYRSLVVALFAGLLFSYNAYSQTESDPKTDTPLEVKIGQMLKIGFRGMEIADTNHIVRDIEKYHLGGVVLFDYDVPRGEAVRNIESPEQVKNLVQDLKKQARIPIIVSIDQEGGQVARLKPKYGFTKTVSAQYLGEIDNPDSTRYYARQTAETLSNLGINVNLAPVVDVNINPENPVIGSIERSFSADPKTVAKHASIYINTLHEYNILTVLKHFPGHGSSKKDSHLGVVDVTETWSEKELIPYRKLIDWGLADAVMTAHIFNARLDSTYPATLSKPTIAGILRDDLDFDGVVISDDLMMGAIREEYGFKTTIKQALEAGVDILSFANNSVYDPDIVPKAHKIINKLIENGEISKERIDQSYQRIIRFKERMDE